MTTVFDFELKALDGAPLDLGAFRGRPMLIVNTASQCGFTPQYAGLQALWQQYRDRGLTVLGVPSNDFGRQEPGSAAEIADFCQVNFRLTFPLSQKLRVRGDAADPLFKWLAREGGFLARPRWNFYKYLAGRDGQLAAWFGSLTPPGAAKVRRAIEEALAN